MERETIQPARESDQVAVSYSVSVITCSHNPRPDYFAQVVDALNQQSLPKASWEYLLIDNASNEALADKIDLSWHPNARHVHEPQLGLTHARLRGIVESAGDLLVFVDDDNVLDDDYLECAIIISQQHPNIGAFGGQRSPVFELTPQPFVKRHWAHLALSEFEKDVWSNQPNLSETMPNGAGLCVRKRVSEFYLSLHAQGKRAFLMDRKGGSLVSGGDVDLATCACDLGLGVGLFTSLSLKHLIEAKRLSAEYLLRLAEGIGYSGVILESFRPTMNGNGRSWLGKAADLLRYLRMDHHQKQVFRAKQRGELKAKADLAAARQQQP